MSATVTRELEELLPIAVLTSEGGVDVVLVEEVDGVLYDRASGAELDLVSLVVVLGLPELEAA